MKMVNNMKISTINKCISCEFTYMNLKVPNFKLK